jgi:hypothetical protein
MARTEAGLAWGSNSSNSLTASSRPRLLERTWPVRRRTGGPASAFGTCGGSIGGGGAARVAA